MAISGPVKWLERVLQLVLALRAAKVTLDAGRCFQAMDRFGVNFNDSHLTSRDLNCAGPIPARPWNGVLRLELPAGAIFTAFSCQEK